MSVQVTDDAKPSAPRLPWPYAAWALPFFLLYVEWSWWQIFRRELESSPVGAGMPVAAAAALSVCGKLLAHVSEAGFYVLLWRARGSRLAFWRFLTMVILASMADQLAYGLAEPFETGDAPLWRVLLSGLHLASGTPFHDAPALRAAFGSIGILSATRIGLTAWAEAKGTARPLLEAIAWTVTVWLLTRIAVWWAFDLLRGMSPLGG